MPYYKAFLQNLSCNNKFFIPNKLYENKKGYDCYENLLDCITATSPHHRIFIVGIGSKHYQKKYKTITTQLILLKELYKNDITNITKGKIKFNGVYACWYNDNGILHRDNGPAVENINGDKVWYQNGKIHRRSDKPALVKINGTKEWYKNDELHRRGDKPAIITRSGDKFWYKKGKLDRGEDRPAVIYKNGTMYWYKKGKIHRRCDKPAVLEYGVSKEWWVNGVLHRRKGPAVEYIDGCKEWWLKGVLVRQRKDRRKNY